MFPPRSLQFVLTAGEVLSAGKSGFLELCRFFCIIIVFFLELLSLYNAVVPANRAFDAIHGSFFVFILTEDSDIYFWGDALITSQ